MPCLVTVTDHVAPRPLQLAVQGRSLSLQVCAQGLFQARPVFRPGEVGGARLADQFRFQDDAVVNLRVPPTQGNLYLWRPGAGPGARAPLGGPGRGVG